MVLSRSGLVNLRVLAHVQRGDKLNAHYQLFQIEPGGPGIYSVLRKLRGDSRRVTVDAISTLIDDALVSAMSGDMDVIEYIHQARPGLHNLCYTYREDVTTCAAFEIIIDKLNAQLGPIPNHNVNQIETSENNSTDNQTGESWLDE